MKPRLATFEEVAPFLKRIDRSNVYTNHGPLVLELEESYSKYLKVDKELVVAVTNATQAIQGLISISNKEDWIVPDYTFSASGLAVLNANRNLHICDVSLFDWKIDVDLIEEDYKSFGIIPVMPFGSAIDFEPYTDFKNVVIDAAASLGAIPPAFSKMRSGWAVVYSLHATKVLGAGEGAIVVCGDSKLADLLRAWINFGFLVDRNSEIQGTNAKMSEMNAAYGLYSILNIDTERADWLESQEFVTLQTSDCPWSTFVNSTPQFHSYWIASFKDKEEKNLVTKRLDRAGIQSRDWWAKPLSMQKAFLNSNVLSRTGNAEYLSGIHLGLPMYRGLSDEFVLEICEIIKTGLKK
jgi:dTDP-4-amino-4,6-dideoxygalactose transaminase